MSSTPAQNLIDELIFSVARIECETPTGVQCGTGYFFAFLLEDGKRSPCLVTSKHVVAGATHGRFYLALKDAEGKLIRNQELEFKVPNFEDKCHPHPDPSVDLVVFFVGAILQAMKHQGHVFHIAYLSRRAILSREQRLGLSVLEDVFVIGFPIGLWDRWQSQPVVRRGITATHAGLPYNGTPEFLIDGPCDAGLGGAPVFLRLPADGPEPPAGTRRPTRVALLGTLYAGEHWSNRGESILQPIEVRPHLPMAELGRHRQGTLGLVVNTDKILDFELIVRAMIHGASSRY